MKKLGFTLSELLVTLGVIGVVAALTAPAISDLMPDSNKLTMIKIVNNVETITADILENPGLYNYRFDSEGNPICIGLECDGKPTSAQYTSVSHSLISGDKKFPYLISEVLGLEEKEDETGSTWPVDEDKRAWSIKTGTYTEDGLSLKRVEIIVDLNGTKNGPNSVYSDSVTKPDRFSFYIDREGMVFPADPLMAAYMNNSMNLNARKEDRAWAKKHKTKYQDYKAFED